MQFKKRFKTFAPNRSSQILDIVKVSSINKSSVDTSLIVSWKHLSSSWKVFLIRNILILRNLDLNSWKKIFTDSDL